MATGTQLQAKISAKLAALNATPRVVKFREFSRVGGNPRLGIGGSDNTTDTLVVPQPAARCLTAEEVAGSNGLLQPGDWEFIFAGSVPEDTLRNQMILFGDTEVLNIVRIEPYPLNGVVVAWGVTARTTQTR